MAAAKEKAQGFYGGAPAAKVALPTAAKGGAVKEEIADSPPAAAAKALSKESKFLRRAGFLKHNLWVTSYKSDEIFPGGDFPNQNPRIHEGLATWVQKDRSLEETNIVLWYVFGITHIPRLEDWPVMPVEHSGFMLMPHGFFNCSPAVDVPPPSDVDAKEAETPKEIHTELISKL